MVGRNFKRMPADRAAPTAEAFVPLLDPVPSVVTGTRRREDVSAKQESAVAEALRTDVQFVFDTSRAVITVLDALERGADPREGCCGLSDDGQRAFW